MGPITLSNIRLRVRTTTTEETFVEETRVEAGGTIALGDPHPAQLEIWASVYPGASTWYFLGQTLDNTFSLGNGVKAIVDLAGGDASDFQLPDTLQTLGNIHLQACSVALNLRQQSVEHISLTVGSDATWSLVPESVTIGKLSVSWFVLFPLDKQFQHNSITLAGVLSFGRGQNAIACDVGA